MRRGRRAPPRVCSTDAHARIPPSAATPRRPLGAAPRRPSRAQRHAAMSRSAHTAASAARARALWDERGAVGVADRVTITRAPCPVPDEHSARRAPRAHQLLSDARATVCALSRPRASLASTRAARPSAAAAP
eukprot:IDg17665t1